MLMVIMLVEHFYRSTDLFHAASRLAVVVKDSIYPETRSVVGTETIS